MRLRTVVFGTVGLLATGVAASSLRADGRRGVACRRARECCPDNHPPRWQSDRRTLCGPCRLARWASGGGSPTAFDVAVDSLPDDVTATESRLFAADIDAAIDDAVAGDDAAMDTVTERLTAAATTAYAIGAGVSQASAQQAVRAGTWTDDAVAAAMLSPTEPQSLLARLRRGSTRRASAAAASAGRSTLSHRCREVSADDAPPCAARSGGLADRAVWRPRLAFDRASCCLLSATAIPLHLRRLRLVSRRRLVPLQATRSVSDAQPTPGEPVAVELTLTNTGSSSLTDVRVIDGVPEELPVVEGSPRLCPRCGPTRARRCPMP